MNNQILREPIDLIGREGFFEYGRIMRSDRENNNQTMIKFFRKSKVEFLQRKYDKLMHEAYILSKANPEESMKKQMQAMKVQRDILSKNSF